MEKSEASRLEKARALAQKYNYPIEDKTTMELCDDIKTAGAVKKAKHQKMIKKAQEILPQHENKSEWIKLFVEEKKKTPLKITKKKINIKR